MHLRKCFVFGHVDIHARTPTLLDMVRTGAVKAQDARKYRGYEWPNWVTGASAQSRYCCLSNIHYICSCVSIVNKLTERNLGDACICANKIPGPTSTHSSHAILSIPPIPGVNQKNEGEAKTEREIERQRKPGKKYAREYH